MFEDFCFQTEWQADQITKQKYLCNLTKCNALSCQVTIFEMFVKLYLFSMELTCFQIQYVKLVGTSKGGTTLVPVQTISSLSTKTIPVALQSSLMNSSQTTFKVVPISSSSSSGQTVKQVRV